MGALFPGSPPAGPLLINDEFTQLSQMAMAKSLDQNRLANLYWTVTSRSSIFDPVAVVHRVTWPEFNTTFAKFTGTPEYRTLKQLWATIETDPYSVHYREDDRVLKSFLASGQWSLLMDGIGKGGSQKDRQLLIRSMAIAETLLCFDGQNLADTDHPGLIYDSATDSYTDVVQVNFAPATNFDDAGVKEMVGRMTSFHDTSGNSYGNEFAVQSDQPPTDDIRTQAPTPPQFHVYAGTDVIDDVEELHRTINNTSKFAGKFSYDKIEELPPKRWVVQWLNNPMADTTFKPFIRRSDGLQVFVAERGEHLENMQTRTSQIHAHHDSGFAPFQWAPFYVGDKP
jgi:hypothetical protein